VTLEPAAPHLTVTVVDFAIIQTKLSEYRLAALKEGRRSICFPYGRLLLPSQPCRWSGEHFSFSYSQL
jgi:hypothetical protein